MDQKIIDKCRWQMPDLSNDRHMYHIRDRFGDDESYYCTNAGTHICNNCKKFEPMDQKNNTHYQFSKKHVGELVVQGYSFDVCKLLGFGYDDEDDCYILQDHNSRIAWSSCVIPIYELANSWPRSQDQYQHLLEAWNKQIPMIDLTQYQCVYKPGTCLPYVGKIVDKNSTWRAIVGTIRDDTTSNERIYLKIMAYTNNALIKNIDSLVDVIRDVVRKWIESTNEGSNTFYNVLEKFDMDILYNSYQEQLFQEILLQFGIRDLVLLKIEEDISKNYQRTTLLL